MKLPMNLQWLPQLGRRRLPLLLALLIFLVTFGFLGRRAWKNREPPGDPLEACSQVIAEAGVPSLDEINQQKHVPTHGNSYNASNEEQRGARIISASKLMELVENGEHPGSRILHQSWKDQQLPEHFTRWSVAWQRQLDETWLYVLWTDENNKKLVHSYYPEYLEVYESLPREIYRADMASIVRNMYMHRFGGIYADLDLVPLGTFPSQLPIPKITDQNPVPIAYLGYMGDESYSHSIPNAFMFSATTEHPFWLRPLQFVKENQSKPKYNNYPETLTGPVALRTCVRQWAKESKLRAKAGELAEVTVLSNDKIYPFSWHEPPLAHQCLCRPHSPHFNELRCQWLFPSAWTITYGQPTMSSSQSFVFFDGLDSNVQLANALIDEYKVELSTAQAHISRIIEEQKERHRALLLNKTAMREELLRQIEKQERIEVEQLEAEFNARRVPFEDEMRSIQAKIHGVKSTVAPVRKLPAEILGDIFREVVRHGVAPWLLATVSRNWRIISLTTPSLWSNLYVGGLDNRYGTPSRWTVDGEPRYTSGNRMLCRTVDELAYSAKKSGAVPLDVLIDPRVAEYQDEVLRSLLGEAYSSRISFLSLSNPKSEEKMVDWTVGRFPLLRNLCCRSLQEPIIESILSQTSQLHTLTVWHELSSALLHHPVWKSLRVLNLGYHTQVTDFHYMVSELSLIEEIYGVPKPWPNEATSNVTLEHIKSITLSCPPECLARLRLPRLEKLYWSGINVFLTHPRYLVGETQWNLSFPEVVWFEASAAGWTFEAALRYLPNVQTVFLKPNRTGDNQDAWALDLLKSLANAENMLCPRVLRLTVGTSTSRISTSKILANPIIRRLIKSRVELGIPLEHFEISWTRRSGKEPETIQYI